MGVHKAKKEFVWIVNTNDDGTFKDASLNGKPMKAKILQNEKVDTNRMQKDFDDHPDIDGGNVVIGNTYAYCLPLRNSHGQIIGWTCGLKGPYTCG